MSRANAHPHVFIVQRLNLVFHENWLAGIKVRWKMDDMFASMIAEDHDKKRNGTLEADEVKSVKENAFFYPGVEFFVKIIVWQHQLKQSMSGIVSVLGLRYVIERSG
ncbi:DUF1007 family protein [uncultured Desulfosarcina sp.]|uniref:DUF1007 family protein n=1 Tax=uncultured Desulfosarcina sp. TaxID=218289 RepID=UPI0029C921CC|nr:DUF1007 family protein [uncultured Desulfosarcina sp.]